MEIRVTNLGVNTFGIADLTIGFFFRNINIVVENLDSDATSLILLQIKFTRVLLINMIIQISIFLVTIWKDRLEAFILDGNNKPFVPSLRPIEENTKAFVVRSIS